MSYAKFIEMVEKSIEMTSTRASIAPDYGIYIHAKSELYRIFDLAKKIGEIPKTMTDIGLMAAKELDDTDPEYADFLHEIAYAVRPA
jgi:hypothetical protein